MSLLFSSFFPGNDVGLLHEKVLQKENLLTINVGKRKTLTNSTAEGLVALVEQLMSVHAKKTVSVHHCSLFPIRMTNDVVLFMVHRDLLNYFHFSNLFLGHGREPVGGVVW